MRTYADKIGKLGFRIDGQYWSAYWMPPRPADSMLLASIQLAIVRSSPETKKAFMDLAENAMSEFILSATGQNPVWSDIVPAPESEKSGNA